jgi:Fur family ferric uptake transcriptional regulator
VRGRVEVPRRASQCGRHLRPGPGNDRHPPDKSTVYRTLEALEDAGLLAHSHLGHGPSVYHLAEDAGHQHLICRSCGATVTLDEAEAALLARRITESTGFVPDPNHFALSGLCASCAALGV